MKYWFNEGNNSLGYQKVTIPSVEAAFARNGKGKMVSSPFASGGDWTEINRVRNNILGVLPICKCKIFYKSCIFFTEMASTFLLNTLYFTVVIIVANWIFFLEVVCMYLGYHSIRFDLFKWIGRVLSSKKTEEGKSRRTIRVETKRTMYEWTSSLVYFRWRQV